MGMTEKTVAEKTSIPLEEVTEIKTEMGSDID